MAPMMFPMSILTMSGAGSFMRLERHHLRVPTQPKGAKRRSRVSVARCDIEAADEARDIASVLHVRQLLSIAGSRVSHVTLSTSCFAAV